MDISGSNRICLKILYFVVLLFYNIKTHERHRTPIMACFMIRGVSMEMQYAT